MKNPGKFDKSTKIIILYFHLCLKTKILRFFFLCSCVFIYLINIFEKLDSFIVFLIIFLFCFNIFCLFLNLIVNKIKVIYNYLLINFISLY